MALETRNLLAERTRMARLPLFGALVAITCTGACSGTESAASGLPAGGAAVSVADGGASEAGVGGNLVTGGSKAVGGSAALGGSNGTGGHSTTGGSSTSVTGTGGNVPTGGSKSSGGNAASGGSTGTGGRTATGGSSSSVMGTGGNSPTGGSKAVGGNSATGGSSATGGVKAAGGATTTGGQPSTGGSSNTGGSSSSGGSHAICGFASGLNVAWVNFAADVPNPNLTTFNTLFKNTHDAGGRIIRWWFHTNGTKTPGYDSSGTAMKLQQSHIDGVKAILNAAATNKVAVTISLWSFDMLQSNAGSAYTNNKNLLEVDANRQAYIDNYLTPLVTALKGTAGLYSYEIFNEPEGMGPNGWATYRTTQAAIQKTVNWLTAAIHTADPTALVTNGAQTFDTCSSAGGKSNWYSDTALRNVGGKQNGTLDYYEVHYYSSNGTGNAPFGRASTYWGLDKKLVIGEFNASTANNGIAGNDTYTNLYTNGYSGAWAWAYTADWPWPSMQVPMQNLYTAHSDVGNCP